LFIAAGTPPLDQREIMNIDAQLDRTAIAAAEEVLRVIYGEDLEGCTVSVDRIAAPIRRALDQQANHSGELTQLHEKGFEAVQLLSTPPADGAALSANDLRSMLSERLDKIHSLSSQIIAATAGAADATRSEVSEADE
jgi:hypothetical protein